MVIIPPAMLDARYVLSEEIALDHTSEGFVMTELIRADVEGSQNEIELPTWEATNLLLLARTMDLKLLTGAPGIVQLENVRPVFASRWKSVFEDNAKMLSALDHQMGVLGHEVNGS